jgi:hypothetical protein
LVVIFLFTYVGGGGIKGVKGETTPLLTNLQQPKVTHKKQRERKEEGTPSSAEQGGKERNDHETSKRGRGT